MDKETVDIIQSLLDVLPDNTVQNDYDWDEAWDSLRVGSQERVVQVRERATNFINKPGGR